MKFMVKSGKVTDLRITSGALRGQKILTPKLAVTHPMGSRERLAIMNSLSSHLEGKVVLDVFSGTGALGFEALSRGAKHVSFIENHREVAKLIRQNAENLGVSDQVRIFAKKAEALTFDNRFDIVFADPPYDKITPKLADYLATLPKLAKEFLVLSHPATFDPHQLDAEIISTKAYAGSRITIFKV